MSFFEYIFEAMRKKTIDRLESQGLDRSLILKPVLEDYEAEPYKKFEPETVQDMIKRVTEDPKKLVNLNSQFRMPGNISDIISYNCKSKEDELYIKMPRSSEESNERLGYSLN